MAKTKWVMEVEEKGDELVVDISLPSDDAGTLLSLETLLAGLHSWGQDIDFKDGKKPKRITKTWYLPTKKVKAKLNPKGKKVKQAVISNDAKQLYRQFNGSEPKEIIVAKAWLPDENSPLVALGEDYCPAVMYRSAKAGDGETSTYIHHFGETGKEMPRIYVTMPPEGYDPMIVITGGGWAIEMRDDGNLWLVD